jgi:hypothetical protein
MLFVRKQALAQAVPADPAAGAEQEAAQ